MLNYIFLILIFNQSLCILINAQINLNSKPVVSIYPFYHSTSSKANPPYNSHMLQQEKNFLTKPNKYPTFNHSYDTIPSAVIDSSNHFYDTVPSAVIDSSKTNPVYNPHLPQHEEYFMTKRNKYQTLNPSFDIVPSPIIDSRQVTSHLNAINNWNNIIEQRSGNALFLNSQTPLQLHRGYRYNTPAIAFSNHTNLKNVIYNELALAENKNEGNITPHGFALEQSQSGFHKTFNYVSGNGNIKASPDTKKHNNLNSNLTTILKPVNNLIFPFKYSEPHELSANYSEMNILKQHNSKNKLNAGKDSKSIFINNTYHQVSNMKHQNIIIANSTLEPMLQSNNYINHVLLETNLPTSFPSMNLTVESSTKSYDNFNDSKLISAEGYRQMLQNDILQDISKSNVIDSKQQVACSSHTKTADINSTESLNSSNIHNLNRFLIQDQVYQEKQNNNIYSIFPSKHEQQQTSSYIELITVLQLLNLLSNSNKELLDDQPSYPSTSLYKNPLLYIPTNTKDNDYNISPSIKPLILDNHKEQYRLYSKNQTENLQNYQTVNVTRNKIRFPIQRNQSYYLNFIPKFSLNAQKNYSEQDHKVLLDNNLLFNKIPSAQNLQPKQTNSNNNLDMINRQIDPRIASSANENYSKINYRFELPEKQQLIYKNQENPQNQAALLSINRYNILNQITPTHQLQSQQGNF